MDTGGAAVVGGGRTTGAVMGVGMRGAGTGVVDFKGGVDLAAAAAAADFFDKTGDVAVTDGEDDDDDSEIALLAPPAVTPAAGVGVGGCDVDALVMAGDPAADLTRTGDGTLVAAGEAVDLDAAGDGTRMAAGDTVLFLAGPLLAAAAAAAAAAAVLAGEAPAALPGVEPGLPDHWGGRARVSFLTAGDLLDGACGAGTVDLFEFDACIDTAPTVVDNAVATGESISILGKGAIAAAVGVLLFALDMSEAGSVLTLTPTGFVSSRSMSIAAAGAW